MSAMCSLFDPSLIALIASSVSPSKDTPAILVDFLQTYSFPNYQSLRLEVVGFHEFVRHSGSNIGLSTVKGLTQFGIRHSELFPVVGFIGKRMLILPVSTVDCERGFSKQNLIKTDLRNSLKPESLSNLMMISIEGPTCLDTACEL